MKASLVVVGMLLTCSSLFAQQEFESLKIWDEASHNAFTDLVRFKGYFYCTFREGESHVPKNRSENGKVRILRSKNGENWESIALLSNEQYDLRDPKISVTPKHQLMVIMGGSDYSSGKLEACLTHVSFSKNGKKFSDPQPTRIDREVESAFDWIWRVTWKGKMGYGVVYQPNQADGEIVTRLLSTMDGVHYQSVCKLNLTGKPNEATIRFDGDKMYIIVRREGSGAHGMLGDSGPPYMFWRWKDLGIRLGGPEFTFYGEHQIALGTRLYRPDEEGGTKTGIVFMNRTGEISKTLEMPSGGDTSYPGMVIYKGKLYMSYYSSHDGKTAIYFSVVQL